MTPQQIAGTILAEFTRDPDLYPSLGMHGNLSNNVMDLSTSTGITITVTITVATSETARVEMKNRVSLVRSAVFTDSSQEGLVDVVVGYIARILCQLNDQAAE